MKQYFLKSLFYFSVSLTSATSFAQVGLNNLNFEITSSPVNGGCGTSTMFPSGFAANYSRLNNVNAFVGNNYTLSAVAQSGANYLTVGNLQTCGATDLGTKAVSVLPNALGSGEPYTVRPSLFSGYYRTQGLNVLTDSVFILVHLTKNGLVIGKGSTIITTNQSSWTNFLTSISYSSSVNPDTIRIRFAAARAYGSGSFSGVNGNNCYLDIDNCSFVIPFSVEQNKRLEESLSIYPNPTSGLFQVQFENTMPQHLKLFDVTGKCVVEQTFFEPRVQMDLQHLNSGVYWMRCANENGITHRKITIVK